MLDQAPDARSATAATTSTAWRRSSSGGTTVGEALNILEGSDLAGDADDADALHRYLEASALAFADRGAYVGDAEFVDVPPSDLLSRSSPTSGPARSTPTTALTKPVAAGDVTSYDGQCCDAPAERARSPTDTENESTTHLTVADRWGNVVAYTLTIEQTGGSGIVVPGRGFLLNNELTDFTTVYDAADPNRIQRRQAAAQLDVADDRAEAAASRSWRSARPAARRSSPRCCRSWSTGSTSA